MSKTVIISRPFDPSRGLRNRRLRGLNFQTKKGKPPMKLSLFSFLKTNDYLMPSFLAISFGRASLCTTMFKVL